MKPTYEEGNQHRWPTSPQGALGGAEDYHRAIKEMIAICPDAYWGTLLDGTEGWSSDSIEPSDVEIMLSDRHGEKAYLCAYRNVHGTKVYKTSTTNNNPAKVLLAFKLAHEANYKSLVAIAVQVGAPK